MKTTPMSDHLESSEGKYSASEVSPQMRKDFTSALAVSDPAEAFFGAFKWNVGCFAKMLHSRFEYSFFV